MADGIGNGGDCCQESGVLDRLATITKKEFGSQTNERTKGIFQSGICRECVGDTTILEWKSLETAFLQPPFDVQESKV